MKSPIYLEQLKRYAAKCFKHSVDFRPEMNDVHSTLIIVENCYAISGVRV